MQVRKALSFCIRMHQKSSDGEPAGETLQRSLDILVTFRRGSEAERRGQEGKGRRWGGDGREDRPTV